MYHFELVEDDMHLGFLIQNLQILFKHVYNLYQ